MRQRIAAKSMSLVPAAFSQNFYGRPEQSLGLDRLIATIEDLGERRKAFAAVGMIFAKNRLPDFQGLHKVRFSTVKVLPAEQESAHLVKTRCIIRVTLPNRFFADLQRSLDQGFGVCQLIFCREDLGEHAKTAGKFLVAIADHLRLKADQFPDPFLSVRQTPARIKLPGLLGKAVGLFTVDVAVFTN